VTQDHLRITFVRYLLQWGEHYPAKKQDTANLDPNDKERVLAHTMWMCEQGIQFVSHGQVEKAMRWLGFIQGVFFSAGIYTIDELRNHSTAP